MPSRINVVFIFLLMTVGFVAIAQDDAPAPERQLTATQFIVDITETAQVDQTPIPATATDEQFAQTATALVGSASQVPPSNNPTQFNAMLALTATQVTANSTATTEAFLAQSEIGVQESDTMSPLMLTISMVGALIILLVVIGSAFAYMNNRQTPKQ